MKKFFSVLTSLASLCLLLFTLLVGSGCPDPKPVFCEAPMNVQVTAIGDSSATLTWTAPPNAVIEISIAPQSQPPGPFTTTANSFTLTGLIPETNYVATLRTLCANGATSEPVTVQFRTSGIIIGDVIIQKGIPEEVKGFCNNGNVDIPAQNSTINWQSSSPLEALKIQNGTTTVVILKNTSGSSPVYTVMKDKETICGSQTSNSPVSCTSILTGFNLDGPSGSYTITIDATKAEMTVSGTTTYTMYR